MLDSELRNVLVTRRRRKVRGRHWARSAGSRCARDNALLRESRRACLSMRQEGQEVRLSRVSRENGRKWRECGQR